MDLLRVCFLLEYVFLSQKLSVCDVSLQAQFLLRSFEVELAVTVSVLLLELSPGYFVSIETF